MKNIEVEILIPLDEHLKTLNLCDYHQAERRQALIEADVLRERDGEENISLPRYTEYALAELDSCYKKAKINRSVDDLILYEAIAKGYIDDWTLFLIRILDLGAKADKTGLKDEIEMAFKDTMADFQTIYEHLRSAFELSFELAFSGQLKERGDQ